MSSLDLNIKEPARPVIDELELPQVMVLPRQFKINGKTVQIPELKPGLATLKDKKGKTIGFYRRYASTDEQQLVVAEIEIPEERPQTKSAKKKKRR